MIVYDCYVQTVLIATLFDHIDFPECSASYCEECDHLEQGQGKSHFGHTITYTFLLMHVANITLCMCRLSILLLLQTW